MKVGEITQVNEKGQSVIPKRIRQAWGLGKRAHINWVQIGKTVYVEPIKRVIGESETKESLLEVLKRTQGSWGPATKAEKVRERKRRAMELARSRRLKKGLW